MDYLGYMTYLAVLLCPFVGVMALPEVRAKMMAICDPLKRTNNHINTVTATHRATLHTLKMTIERTNHMVPKIVAEDLEE
ncbi:unnamed protein product [Adineta steineri]|uniref:Uncharacterized protein n=1 Tax=Adineta steineri TaxID=433720 RepID=A0A813MDH8_9BILA|nr:unnamed protein product [Adineta steineri]CAF3930897.1 unnamed protein product [Adineta steineri]